MVLLQPLLGFRRNAVQWGASSPETVGETFDEAGVSVLDGSCLEQGANGCTSLFCFPVGGHSGAPGQGGHPFVPHKKHSGLPHFALLACGRFARRSWQRRVPPHTARDGYMSVHARQLTILGSVLQALCVTRFAVMNGRDLLGEDIVCTGISVEPMPHSRTLPMLSP